MTLRLLLLAVCLSVVTAGFFGESLDSQLLAACCKEKDKEAKCFELLKGGKADPTREIDGESTLMCAAANDNVAVVMHLVEKDER
jgi:hypothetical protein